MFNPRRWGPSSRSDAHTSTAEHAEFAEKYFLCVLCGLCGDRCRCSTRVVGGPPREVTPTRSPRSTRSSQRNIFSACFAVSAVIVVDVQPASLGALLEK